MSRLVLIAVIVLGIFSAADISARQRVPQGFRELTDDFWDSPWVFDQRGRPLRLLASSRGQLRSGPFSITLDDGSQATLQAQSKDYEAGDDCQPYCGCTAKQECYWVEITNRQGTVLRAPLWASYRWFDIVPVDLIGGRGDELIIITIPTHASPPIGYAVDIWKVGDIKPVELVEQFRAAGTVVSVPVSCARWRSRVFVNLTAPKPRTLTLRTEFAATTFSGNLVCRLSEEESERLTMLKRRRGLRFDRGKYRQY